jgi:hypothetical protein
MGHHSRPRGRSLLFSYWGRTSKASTTAAIASLPSVREPGEKWGPIARIPTNAEAQRTTVTAMAATPSALIRDAGAGGGAVVLTGVLDAMVPI